MNTDNPAIRNILTRTSYRNFDPSKLISPSEVSTILHAAMSAPTGVNRRPWHFVAVSDRPTLDKLAHALPYCHMAASAPLAIVVCGDSRRFLSGDDATLWVQDVSAASENILLAANALGLGAVWTAVYPHPDRAATVRRIINLPEHLLPFNVIPIGHVTATHSPLDKWNPDDVTFI